MVADGPMGRQTPTKLVLPQGGQVIPEVAALCDVAEQAGMPLDPWQITVLEYGLANGPDGLRAALEVVLWIARQNGKTVDLAVLLAGAMPILGLRSAVYSAHLFNTTKETFELTEYLILNSSLAEHYVKSLRGNNEVSITMTTGKIRFLARTKGSGRGLGADLVVLDEAFSLIAAQIGAIMPTLSARPNPQLWYASSAAMADSEQLHNLRRRAAGPEPGPLCWMEWSAPEGIPRHDEAGWAEANPALGRRLSYRWIRTELEAMPAREFERERLSWADEPDGGTELDQAQWLGLVDGDSSVIRPLGFGLDIPPERDAASIAVAGMRLDGLAHVEVVEHIPGLDWLVARAVELHKRWKVPFWIQLGSPAAAYIDVLEARGVEVKTHPEGGGAAALLVDNIKAGTLRHLGQASLARALVASRRKVIGDRWTWSRGSSTEDISPLVAASLALYGALVEPPPPPRRDARIL